MQHGMRGMGILPRSVMPRPRATSPFSVIAQPDMVRNHQSSP
jgi:hypothetical protein